MEIHNHLDSTKGIVADNRHRFITHNAWYIGPDGPLEKIFGIVITNSDDRMIAVRSVAEQHILEDFNGYIPTVSDYVDEMPFRPWMSAIEPPPSAKNRNQTKSDE